MEKFNLQLFGEDEDEAINRIVDINEDYPGGGGFKDGMEDDDMVNAITVCAGQLIRIADALNEIDINLERLANCTAYIPPNQYQKKGHYIFHIGGSVDTGTY